MRIALIAVPYDSGFRAERMGAGPLHLLESGLSTELEAAGHVITVGIRDLDEDEAVAIHASAIRHVPAATLRQDLPTALADAGIAGETAYIHLDLDVLDPGEGPMNQFSSRAGLGLAELEWALATIAAGAVVRAGSLTAFDPASDPTGKARRTCSPSQWL